MTIPTLLLVSLLAIPACAVDDGSGEDDLGDVDTGTTEQAVTGTSVRTFTSTAFGMTTWNDIASGPGTACFLAGVDGNMQAANSNESLLGVYPAGDQWYVTIYNNANHPVSITVACVSGVTNVTDQIFWHGTADTWQSGTANTHCFLTSIGGANHGFSQFDDDVRIDKGFGNNWRFHGTIATANAFMDARMVCFDATYGEGAWGGAWTAMGTVGGPLASNAAGGVACGLTGLGGDFGFSNLSSGVKITYDRLNTQWAWTLSDIKQGSVECIK